MRASTLARLACPFCSGSLTLNQAAVEDEQGVSYGVTGCGQCHCELPIVAGVLIVGEPHQHIGVEAELPAFAAGRGIAFKSLLRLVSDGRHLEAFTRLLGPCTRNADLLARPGPGPTKKRHAGGREIPWSDPHRAPRVPVGLQRRIDRYSGGRLSRRTRRRIAGYLFENQKNLSALDAIELYLARYSRAEIANYLAFRFGQPRHLAALSIASVITQSEGRVLDLACGAGHLTHYLASRAAADAMPIGVDRSFFRLYLARNFVSPDADFICQWVDRPLPFGVDTFGGALCSDAFHYFGNKAGCLRELRRVVRSPGSIGLARFGNREQEPNEGLELSVDGYRRLFGELAMPAVFRGEHELIQSYLLRKGPDLRLEPTRDVRDEKWLSVVLSDDDATFVDHAAFDEWPHAAGGLSVNPIYCDEGRAREGGLRLRLDFPSEWYAFENAACVDYSPEITDVPGDVLEALRAGEITPAIRDLTDRFVVLGLPRRYLPPIQGHR